MGWETRRGGTYYYRKRREGNRVISEYIGSSPLAVAMATLATNAATERQLRAEQEKQEREIEHELREAIAKTTMKTLELARNEGIVRRRGEWRKLKIANSER